MATTLCFIDTETTGLDPRIHQPYEVSWWREDEAKPHTVHDIPEPDHTAEGDVRATRAAYYALKTEREHLS